MSVALSESITWRKVCMLDEVPSAGARVVHSGELEVALFRTTHGAVLAVENLCPHKQGKLSEGIVADHTVICPLHAWRIDLLTGEAVAPDKGCVRRFPVDVRQGEVYLRLPDQLHTDDAPVPLCDVVGTHPDSGRPKLGRRRAQPEDFSVHDFDRKIPVLAVEPPSPHTSQDFRLALSREGKRVAEFSLEDLRTGFETVEMPAHITCLMFGITRPITWQGVRLADLLGGADLTSYPYASFYSWDTTETKEGERFFEPLPREYILDPRTLLAFGMDGEPLPKEHGGPLRLAVPFLQGYKSVKWLTWIDLVQEDQVGYKKRHGFIGFPELGATAAFAKGE